MGKENQTELKRVQHPRMLLPRVKKDTRYSLSLWLPHIKYHTYNSIQKIPHYDPKRAYNIKTTTKS